MPDISYRVVDAWLDDDTPCACGGGCGWEGEAKDLAEIEECALDPGDPSPAGRCPRCESLAYANREKDRMVTMADELLEFARTAASAEMQGSELRVYARDVLELIDKGKL